MDFRQSIFKSRIVGLPPMENTNTDMSKYKPVNWSSYFGSKETIEINDTAFNVYISGKDNSTGPIFFFHHGAGHSGLTFGLVSNWLLNNAPGPCTVVAPDCRAHGDTHGANQSDLSLHQLVTDSVSVFESLFPENTRDVILIGHSMGGAVMTHVAASKKIKGLIGLTVIDIVEGSAIDSLPAIPGFINARPRTFKSVESAIQWHIESDSIQNVESARLSVPSLVTPFQKKDGSTIWRWKIDLMPTERYWREWYEGLSKTFASAPAARLLILAGTDRLDKELLIAQMQGKFQLELLPAAGHTIQEDLPDRVGGIILAFWQRNQRLNIPIKRFTPLPKKNTSEKQ